jgi:hypothetical protein
MQARGEVVEVNDRRREGVGEAEGTGRHCLSQDEASGKRTPCAGE